jgi:hypothetical protein
MLDAIRYMIVWNPLIFLIFSVLVSTPCSHFSWYTFQQRTKRIVGTEVVRSCMMLACMATAYVQLQQIVMFHILQAPLIAVACSPLVQAKLFPHHHVTRHIAVAAKGAVAASSGMAAAPPPPLDAVDMGGLAAGA